MRLYLLLLFTAALLMAAPSLSIFPKEVTLSTPESRQQLLAEAQLETAQADWTRLAAWSSSNPTVAIVSPTGLVTPRSDGETRITASKDTMTASLTV